MTSMRGEGNLTIDYDVAPQDIKDFVHYTLFESVSARRRLLLTRLAIVGLLVGYAGWRATAHPDGPSALGFIAPVALVAIPLAWFITWVSRTVVSSIVSERQVSTTHALGHWTLVVDSEGLHHTHVAGSGSAPWFTIDRIERSTKGVYLFTSRDVARIVPSSAFDNEPGADAFVRFCEAQMCRVKTG